MKFGAHLLVLLLFALLGGGCAPSASPDIAFRNPLDIPPVVMLGNVPFYPQNQYMCGPSALMMVADYWKNQGQITQTPSMRKLENSLFVPAKKGALQIEMVAAARSMGLIPYVIDPTLDAVLKEVADGNPVIVLANLGLSWYPIWHYFVIVGYDLNQKILIVRSGRHEQEEIGFELFEKIHAPSNHWSLVAVPAGKIPKTANTDTFLKAALELEKQGDLAKALIAYKSVRKRWPQSIAAGTATANALFALGKFDEAKTAYLETLALDPKNPILLNNLAMTYLRLGDPKSACQSAKKAMAIGDGYQVAIKETLLEINRLYRCDY